MDIFHQYGHLEQTFSADADHIINQWGISVVQIDVALVAIYGTIRTNKGAIS